MDARILPFSEASLHLVCQALLEGFLVSIPTETVYGLAANALDPKAVREIFEVKGRPFIDPLIVHIASPAQAERFAYTNVLFHKIAHQFWPGPLTVVLSKKRIISDLVTAGQSTVALRCPGHPIMQAVLQKTELPLAAPSANPFGYISPTQPEHVSCIQDPKLKYILDGGPCEHGLESTIVDISDLNFVKILRPGPISRESIEACLGVRVEAFESKVDNSKAEKENITAETEYTFGIGAELKNKQDLESRLEINSPLEDSFGVEKVLSTSGERQGSFTEATEPLEMQRAQLAPGMLSQHYSPHTVTHLMEKGNDDIASYLEKNLKSGTYSTPCAVVLFQRPSFDLNDKLNIQIKDKGIEIFWLTESSNLQEAARNLYTLMHALDKGQFASIVIQKAPEEGIGIAINDRLQRAATKRISSV